MKTFSNLIMLLLIWGSGFLLAGIAAFGLMALSQSGHIEMGECLRVLQWLQTIAVMILPPLLWVRLVLTEPVIETLRLGNWSWQNVGMAIAAMLLLVPAVEWLAVGCYHLPWPESVRSWADLQAQEQGAMMSQMLDLPGVVGFIRAALLVSLATAIGEEMMFRGALMRLCGTRYVLLVALLIGLVFALVHLEVYGLLSRWLLGTLFVYLVYWTRSLWPAIAAHATNNMVALIEYRLDEESVMNAGTQSYFPLWLAVIGAVAAVLLMVAMRRRGRSGVEA